MKIKELYEKYKTNYIDAFGKSFFHDVASIVLMLVAGLLLLATFLIIVFRIHAGDNLVPLTYNSTFGATTLGSWYRLFLYPFSYFIFSLVNFAIAWAFFEKERLISYLTLFIHLITGILFIIVTYNLTVLAVG